MEVNPVTGCITAKSPGTTYIYANAQDGSGVTGYCTVTVTTPNGLKTKERCYVRLETSFTNESILEGSDSHDIIWK